MAKYFSIPFAMNGDRKEIQTDKQEDGSISFDEGYGADYEKNKQVDPTAKDISRQEFNSVLHDITDAIGEIQRSGVATWNNEISYNKGATIIHNGAVYTSTINANKNEPPHSSWSSLDLSEYRKKDDLLFKGMMQVQATDDVGTGVFLMDSSGKPRGQMIYNSYGVQFAQVQEDGSHQTFTFPRFGNGGEIVLDNSLSFYTPEMFNETTVSDSFKKCIEKCLSDSKTMFLGGKTYLLETPIVFSEGLQVISTGATLKRKDVASTSNSPHITIMDNVSLYGDITLDSNFPVSEGLTGEVGYCHVEGTNVYIQSIRTINNPITTLGRQLYSVLVFGDKFTCDKFVGEQGGYSSLRVMLNGDMEFIKLGTVEVYDYNYKGFSVGNKRGFSGTLKSLTIDSYKAVSTRSFLKDASDGLLVDTSNDNEVMSVKEFRVGTMVISGGESNAFKIENVENFYCDSVSLTVDSLYPNYNAFNLSAKNSYIGSLSWDKGRGRFRGLKLRCSVLDYRGESINELFRVEGLLDSGQDKHLKGVKDYVFNTIELASCVNVMGIDIKQDNTYSLVVNNVKGSFTNATALFDSKPVQFKMSNVCFYNLEYSDYGKLNAGSELNRFVKIKPNTYATRLGLSSLNTGNYKKGDIIMQAVNTATDSWTIGYIVTDVKGVDDFTVRNWVI